MKRCVSITLNIDPEEYHRARDTPSGCVNLVIACLRGEADFATTLTVQCNDAAKKVDLDAMKRGSDDTVKSKRGKRR